MRYLLSFLFVIGLVILAFILVISSLHGGSTPIVKHPLVNYASTDTQVQLQIDGPINADQLHYELQMTVGANLSQIELEQGYQGTVIKSQSYANNPSSYAEFLRALDFSGFTKGNTSSKADNDPTGYCAGGDRYTYEIISPTGSNIEHFWSTSCGGQGTFEGNAPAILDLFSSQMPDYENLVNSTDL